jgi:hypothetical protein
MPLLLMVALAFLVSPLPPAPGAEPPALTGAMEPDTQWKPLGRSVWFDPAAKRLILRAKVVLREGQLEHLLCLKGTKEHEAILATDAQPRQIHAGLLLTGAEPGHPVRFLPKFEPPTGTPIAIDLLWKTAGKTNRATAQKWVRDDKTRTPLTLRWVFAGSDLFMDPVTKKMMYAADDGDLITVANFGSSILDLPIASSASDAERSFSANTEQVPPLGTEVFMILGPKEPPQVKKP